MITLFIDTSTDILTVSLFKDDVLLKESKKESTEHSKYAMSEIENIFKECNILPKSVNKIIVTNGPGSFTGIRIGVTIAKTYAWSCKINVVEASTLKCMALSHNNHKYYVPFIDARRGYVYAGIYDEMYNEVLPDSYILFDDLAKKLDGLSDYVLIGKSVNKEVLKPIIDSNKIYEYYKDDKGISPHKVLPNYLKKTEAEENAKRV